MTPLDALFDLLGRVGASRNAEALVNDDELLQWPVAAVKAMKFQKLIVKARPAKSVICPGCENSCIMPVNTLPATASKPSSFIVCDKRSDINRVAVPLGMLTQWKCNADLISRFVVSGIGLRNPAKATDNADRWEIGTVYGDNRRQMLCLETPGTLTLVVGHEKVPLTEFIEFHEGAYSLDATPIRRMVDSAEISDARYTPSDARREARKLDTQAMYESWRKEYRVLRKKRPGMSDRWYSQQIAKMDFAHRRNAETIRKKMKR